MKRIWIKDTIKKKSEKVKVSGWISSVRSHGKIIFADLRDFSGSLQLVFVPSDKETYEKAKRIRYNIFGLRMSKRDFVEGDYSLNMITGEK